MSSQNADQRRGQERFVSKSHARERVDEGISTSCAVCLEKVDSAVATLDSCQHKFHFECIRTWSKINNTCPLCKKRFHEISGESEKVCGIQDKNQVYDVSEEDLAQFMSEYICERCGGDGDDAMMLLCDGCDNGFHMYCLFPPIHEIPEGEWYCHECRPVERATSRRCPNGQISSSTRSLRFRNLWKFSTVLRVKAAIVRRNPMAMQNTKAMMKMNR
eukprot:96598_1